jgi:hypothetical protein
MDGEYSARKNQKRPYRLWISYKLRNAGLACYPIRTRPRARRRPRGPISIFEFEDEYENDDEDDVN